MKAVLYEKGGRANASVTDVPVPEISDEEIAKLNPLRSQRQGRLCVVTTRKDETETMRTIREWKPDFCETLPLSLEEVFILEMEEQGYAK